MDNSAFYGSDAKVSTIAFGTINDTATVIVEENMGHGTAIYNNTDGELYIILGSQTPTVSLFTVKMESGDYYETPYNYIGKISGIGASMTSGSVLTTEIK